MPADVTVAIVSSRNVGAVQKLVGVERVAVLRLARQRK